MVDDQSLLGIQYFGMKTSKCYVPSSYYFIVSFNPLGLICGLTGSQGLGFQYQIN